MRIAFIGQKGIPAQSGGVERHVEFLAKEILAYGHEVLAYSRKGYNEVKISSFKGIQIKEVPFINSKNFASITQNFFASVDVIFRRADVIHYHGVGPSLLLWIPKIFSPRSRLVATLHSFDYDNEKWGTFARMMLRAGERIMFALADDIIVLTPAMREYAHKKYGRNASLIPNGTEIDAVEGSDILLPWGLRPKGYIFSASRLIKLKGIQYLIEAFRHIDTDLNLVIAGDGEYEEELRNLAQGDKRIIFVGKQSGNALRQLYANSLIFVQSSEMEGLSLSLLEAMGSACMCIASDIPGNREALADCGYYFQSQDARELEEKIRLALSDSEKAAEMAKAAYDRAAQNFNWEYVASSMNEVYAAGESRNVLLNHQED
ncbi:MAG: glycosyltransferase family 4 protein [Bacillota bacterium]